MYGRRIARDGSPVDATPLRLTRLSNSSDQMAPVVVWTGSEFLVAVLSSGLVFVRVSEAGVPSAPIRTGLNIGEPQMSTGRDAVLLTYRDVGRQPRARRFSLTGMPLGSEIVLSSQSPINNLPVSYSNGQWLVAWLVDRASRDIVATRVSDAGMVLDPMGLVLADGAENEEGPTLAPTPSGWLLSYANVSSLRALRVNAMGAVEDPGGIPIGTRCGNATSRSAIVTWGSSGLIAYAASCRYDASRVFVRTLGSL